MPKYLRVVEIETEEDPRYCAAACVATVRDGCAPDCDGCCWGSPVGYERDAAGIYHHIRTYDCRAQSGAVATPVGSDTPARAAAIDVWRELCGRAGFGLESLERDDPETYRELLDAMTRAIARRTIAPAV